MYRETDEMSTLMLERKKKETKADTFAKMYGCKVLDYDLFLKAKYYLDIEVLTVGVICFFGGAIIMWISLFM